MDFWNYNLSEAPANTRILVQSHGDDMWATYDPLWGKGRGAWFNDKNQIIAKVWCFCTDSDAYIAQRPTGHNVTPIK